MYLQCENETALHLLLGLCSLIASHFIYYFYFRFTLRGLCAESNVDTHFIGQFQQERFVVDLNINSLFYCSSNKI